MKKPGLMKSFLTILSLCLIVVPSAVAADLTPDEIVRRSSETDKLLGWKSRITMRLIAKNSSDRVREGSMFNRLDANGQDAKRLIRFTAPADIKGTNILVHEHRDGNDDIWTYLPAMKKVRRLISSNKKDSFVGTDFSYHDIVTPRVRDYSHTLLKQEAINGIPCYVIESIPRTEQIKRDTGYAKTITWIRTDTFVRSKAELFDMSGRLGKIMNVGAIKEMDRQRNKWLTEKVEMRNVLTGHVTIIEFKDIIADASISDDLFAPNRLDQER